MMSSWTRKVASFTERSSRRLTKVMRSWLSKARIAAGVVVCVVCAAGQESPGPGTQARDRLNGSAAFTLECGRGDFVRLRVVAEADAILSITGTALRSVAVPAGVGVRLSFDAPGGGRAEVKVQAKQAAAHQAEYRMWVEERRAGTADDDLIRSGDQVSAEAAALVAAADPESLRGALTRAEKALAIWRRLGRMAEIAEALVEVANIAETLGDADRARTGIEEATQIAQDAGRADLVARAWNARARMDCRRMRGGGEAVEAAERGYGAAMSAGATWEAARALTLHGYALEVSGRLEEAEPYHRRAVEQWQADGWRRGQAEALLELGFNLIDQGKEEAALMPLEEARGIWTMLADHEALAKTLQAFGALHIRMDRKEEALRVLDEAQRLLPARGAEDRRAVLNNSMAQVYYDLGEYARAYEYYSKALALFRGTGDQRRLAGTAQQVARCAERLGRRDEALKLLEQSLAMFEAQGDRRWQARVMQEIALLHLNEGNGGKAASLAARALDLIGEGGDSYFQAECHRTLALTHHRAKNWERAEQHYSLAIELLRHGGYRQAEAWTTFHLAKLEAERGKLAEAKQRLEGLTELVESVRSQISGNELRASYFASMRDYFELYVDVLMQLEKREPSHGHAAQAFLVNERANSRALMESLREGRVEVRAGADPALLAREEEIRRRMNRLAERQLRAGDPGGAEARRVLDELAEASAEYERVQALIRSRNPRYARLMRPEPLRLDQVQEQLLDLDTVLVEYMLGEERSYLWATGRDCFATHTLPGRAVVERAVVEFRAALTAREPRAGETGTQRRTRIREAEERLPDLANRLTEMLLAPVEQLVRGKRLIIVADGALRQLPFAALRAPGTSGDEGEPLVAEHELIVAPSASTLAVMLQETAGRASPPKWLAVLADPVFEADDPRLERRGEPGGRPGLARLPATGLEARRIVELAPPGSAFVATGPDASRDRVLDESLRNYRIIHFATHSLLHQDHPELSGVALAAYDAKGRARAQWGMLRLHDVYGLRLPVEMVVMSSCESNLGKVLRGEGLIGMVRGFFYAGAKRVVASLWNVDDEATRVLMESFYAKIFLEGATPASALRQAQLAMWRQPEWRSPYYWAAFVLQGDWR